MVFVETSLFTKLLAEYLSDDEYRGLQNHLIGRPDVGAIIRGSSGVRKVRWAVVHSRCFRFQAASCCPFCTWSLKPPWIKADEQIVLLTLYGKGEKENLSAAELKRIVKIIEELT